MSSFETFFSYIKNKATKAFMKSQETMLNLEYSDALIVTVLMYVDTYPNDFRMLVDDFKRLGKEENPDLDKMVNTLKDK